MRFSGRRARAGPGGQTAAYPIRSAINPNALLSDRDVDSNKLLRDRDGGLWIGTHQRGIIHMHNGRADVFTKSDGLSGNIICSLFEDREGNVWVGTSSRGLDRFRELPVSTISIRHGLSRVLYSLISRHRWEHLGSHSRWLDQVEEWTNHNLPQGGWAAG